ncbi:hypothetical protein GYB22_00575 [bacterium]|nr:hypothetical protein [bacterium]
MKIEYIGSLNQAVMTDTISNHEEDFIEVPQKKKRPDFLTVICILTFIGSGWGLINAGISLFSTNLGQAQEEVEAAFDEATEQMEYEEDAQEALDIIELIKGGVMTVLEEENARMLAAISFGSCFLTLLGAIFMFQLRKFGYYMYVIGIAILLFGPMILLGGNLGLVVGVINSFFGLIFVIMYSANLKHLA